MSTLPKAIYTFNAICMKIPIEFFHRARTNNPKIYIGPQQIQIAKTILKKKSSKRKKITILYFKLNYKAVVIKTV